MNVKEFEKFPESKRILMSKESEEDNDELILCPDSQNEEDNDELILCPDSQSGEDNEEHTFMLCQDSEKSTGILGFKSLSESVRSRQNTKPNSNLNTLFLTRLAFYQRSNLRSVF